jgi:hypothetical protein
MILLTGGYVIKTSASINSSKWKLFIAEAGKEQRIKGKLPLCIVYLQIAFQIILFLEFI